MKKNDIWSFKNIDEYFDPRFGLVYKDFGNNAFEIVLCSTDYDHLSEEDIVIPAEETNLEYSIIAHSDMIFPIYKSDKKLNKKIGTLSDNALQQIGLIRKDIKETEKSEIRFRVGGPIFYRSDKRYFMKLTNLEFVNHYSENSFQKLLLDIPDNVVPFITYKSENNMFDEMLNIKGREQADLISRQFLALQDRKFKYQDYIHQVTDDEDVTVSINFESMERDIRKVLVA
tara:strand:+ start:428 stop:1114 length:687 start_codon:yes stop_codon:yes gene_type:complete